jgi:hypothetical protein
VAFVDRSIEFCAAPAQVEVGSNLELREDPTHGDQTQRLDVAALDNGDDRLAESGSRGQVGLAPAPSSAEGPDDQANPSIVHIESLDVIAYQARICG